MKRNRGFTLMELMIVVAVMAILAAVAYGSYNKQVKKSRRAQAVQFLTTVVLLQEKYRADHPTYGTCAQLGAACTSLTNQSPYYTLSFDTPAPDGVSYTLTATPKAQQVGDTCGTYSFTMTNGNLTKGAGGGTLDCL